MAPTEPDDDAFPGFRPPWSQSDRTVPRRLVRPLQEFLETSTAGGVFLVVAAAVAVVWANLPDSGSYERFWTTTVSLGVGHWHLVESLRTWVNDGLMTLFFLVVGLEIKRELVTGELRDRRAAALPVIAAVGGMLVPALLYLAINASGPERRGWGIAMPTDIAFTLGVLAIATRNGPSGLRSFLLSLAIVDDILTIVVIGLFYPTEIRLAPLGLVVGVVVVIVALERIHVRMSAVYVALGVMIWLALHASGVEPALAGVIVGLLTPAVPFQRPSHVSREAIRVADATVDEPDPPDADASEWLRLAWLSREAVSPLGRAEHQLLPWTTFVVLPLFALANVGVRLSAGMIGDALTSPVAIGIVVAHVAGKVLGIGGAAWLGVRFRVGRLPTQMRLAHIFAVGAAAGVAFTVSIFVAEIAFVEYPELVTTAKLGVLFTFIAVPIGVVWLRAVTRRDATGP